MNKDSGTTYVGMRSPDGQWQWDGAQWVSAPAAAPAKKRPVGLIVSVLAVLIVIVIGAALYSNHQRTDQAKQRTDQLSHCLDLSLAGTPDDQLPSYCP